MAKVAKDVFVVGAKRTAFGAYGGRLCDVTPATMGAVAAAGALRQARLDSTRVDHVIFGNVVQASADAIYLARHIGLKAGIDQRAPAVTINRLCGSGFEAIVQGCQQIVTGRSSVVVAGGSESMSQPAYVVRGVRFGLPFGKSLSFDDYLWQCFTDSGIGTPMGGTAENLASLDGITREDSDVYAIQSQERWQQANAAGRFLAEIEPIIVRSRKGEEQFEVDEHPRETTIERLAKLAPVFRPDGVVTAGNSSGVCDGAAALVLADGAALGREGGGEPLARVAGWATVGCEPKIMGVGPVDAIRRLTDLAGVCLDDIDLIEINEAFAAQVLAVQRRLDLDTGRLNTNGGAIAVGHPLAASGARISAHLVHEMIRRKARYGIGAACIGGGQGIAVLFESV